MFTAKETVSDLLYYDKKPVLELYIEYPQVSGPFSKFSEEKFNSYYLKKARRENRHARETVYFETVREYKALKKEGFPFMLNSYRSTFEEEFSSEKYVSLTFDLYTFTGGAHGFTERTADTWDMKRGERVGLSEVCRECTPEKNIAEVRRQIKENPEIFFPDAETLAAKNYNPKNFYIKDGDVYVFYPLYSIAPYSSGILSFKIT